MIAYIVLLLENKHSLIFQMLFFLNNDSHGKVFRYLV